MKVNKVNQDIKNVKSNRNFVNVHEVGGVLV